MSSSTPRFQCRHIHTAGHRCGSPCLRDQPFCYFHHTTRRPVQDLKHRRAAQGTFDVSNPEDRTSIQLTIGEVLRRIALNQIDPRRAGLLLYGLQIASCNLPRLHPTETSTLVEDATLDPEHGHLAPSSPFLEPAVPKNLEEILMEQWDLDRASEANALPNPGTGPTLTPIE